MTLLPDGSISHLPSFQTIQPPSPTTETRIRILSSFLWSFLWSYTISLKSIFNSDYFCHFIFLFWNAIWSADRESSTGLGELSSHEAGRGQARSEAGADKGHTQWLRNWVDAELECKTGLSTHPSAVSPGMFPGNALLKNDFPVCWGTASLWSIAVH